MNNNEFNNNVYPSSNQNSGNGYTQQPTQPQPTQPQMNTGYTQQPVQNLNNNYSNITPDKKENKNIKKIILIIITLLVVGGVAFAGYKFLFKNKITNKDFMIKNLEPLNDFVIYTNSVCASNLKRV